jgi:lycopene cyclase domain-containing protein
MDWNKFTYMGLMLFTVSVPLIRSFEHRINYFSRWKYLGPAILFPMIIFIIWDVIFTANGIWVFNDDYVTGYYFLGLPLEEWSFFIAVPFACVFVYEVLNLFVRKFYFPKISLYLTIAFLILSLVLALTNTHRTYTFVNFLFAAGVLTLQLVLKVHKTYLSRSYLAYFVNLIPFLLVNGVLTALPVVIYNNNENLATRIYTIPVEDTFYFLSLYLLNINIYEYLLQKSGRSIFSNKSTLGTR